MEMQPADVNALLIETVQAIEPLANEMQVRVVIDTPGLPKPASMPFASGRC